MKKELGTDLDPMVVEAQKAIISLGDYLLALEPIQTQDIKQILLCVLRTEMPERLLEIYYAELGAAIVPMTGKLGGGFNPAFVTPLIPQIVQGTVLNAFIMSLLPESVRPWVGTIDE